MFTGIIECLGEVKAIIKDGLNLHLTIESSISSKLKIDQSVSHNGVCLTVINKKGNTHTVTIVKESLTRTQLGELKSGDIVNLERCMLADGRFDGHIVQGHVDTTAICQTIDDQNGSKLIGFKLEKNTKLIVEKGSICINGISLTIVNTENNLFSIALIPYTLENTSFKTLRVGDKVNIEFDVIGKYIAKMLA
jgi:riboflavin synthase